jgi:Zn-finger nucleic acid-binding protein
MNRSHAEGHYGAKVIVYKCPICSGLWLDGNVVTAISCDSAIGLESDASFDDISTEPRKLEVFCPRCETSLFEPRGGDLPNGLRIDICKFCGGYWFDKGELMIYKSHSEKKKRKFVRSETEKRKE